MALGLALVLSAGGLAAHAETAPPKHNRVIVKEDKPEPAPEPSRVDANPSPWTGDLDGMKDRQVIRILVPYSKTLFFYDKKKEMGVVHDLGVSLEKWANQQSSPEQGQKGLKVVFVPVPEERLLPDLMAGLGDMAAGGLTVGVNGQGQIDFGGSLAPDSGAVIVTRKRGDSVEALEDLSGREVVIHRSNASYEPLRTLSRRLEAQGRMRTCCRWSAAGF